jgi:fatty acid desaturase
VIRFAVSCAALGALCVVANIAAGTVFAVPLAVGVVVFALWLVFHEDRALKNLEAFERRNGPRNPSRLERRG